MVGASAIVFLVAIPMHTCGVIPCIYLLLFTLANREQFSRKSLLVFGALSCVFAAAGAAILIYPGISSFAGSLALFSLDGNRFSGLRGEYFRVRNFVRNPVFSPLLIFIASVYLVSLACAYKHIRLHSLKPRLNIMLFLVAVVIGLGVLPSATWEDYMVYYYLPLVLGFSIAFDVYVRHGGSLVLLRCALVLSGTFSVLVQRRHNAKTVCCAVRRRILFCRRFCTAHAPSAADSTDCRADAALSFSGNGIDENHIRPGRAKNQGDKGRGFGRHLVCSFRRKCLWGQRLVDRCKNKDHPRCRGRHDRVEVRCRREGRADKQSSSCQAFRACRIPRIRSPCGLPPGRSGPLSTGSAMMFCNISAFLESQEKPLRYVTIKKTPLSNELLDTYALNILRGLMFVEYSCPQPTP